MNYLALDKDHKIFNLNSSTDLKIIFGVKSLKIDILYLVPLCLQFPNQFYTVLL